MDLSGLKSIYQNDYNVSYMLGRLIWAVQIICYGTAVIILLIKGVKMMKAAPEAKADVKKELISYAIGAFILFGVGTIVRLVGNIAINL